MSTLSVNSIVDTSGGNTVTVNGIPLRQGVLDPENRIINGAFDFWQRGTSFTTSVYGADRWFSGFSDGTVTQSRQSFGLGDTLGSNNPTYFLRQTVSAQTLTSAYAIINQRIEGVRSYAGQTITVLGWARRSSGTGNMVVEFGQNFGTGGTPSTTVNGFSPTTVTLTESWSPFAVTVTLPSITGKIIGTNLNDFLSINFWISAGSTHNTRTNSLGIQTIGVDLWGIHIKLGTHTAAAVNLYKQPELGPELARCQRYFSKSYNIDITPGTVSTVGSSMINTGSFTTLTNRYDLVMVKFPQTMRTMPTVTIYNFMTGTTGTMRAQNAETNLASVPSDISTAGFSMGLNNQTVAATDILRGHYTADAEL